MNRGGGIRRRVEWRMECRGRLESVLVGYDVVLEAENELAVQLELVLDKA